MVQETEALTTVVEAITEATSVGSGGSLVSSRNTKEAQSQTDAWL